jgi:uncharacterized protein YbjT (DUF2867 family)
MDGLILVTGATGYVGGRLLRRLEEGGRRVRCLVRRPERLRGRVGAATELAAGDVLEPSSLAPAMRDVETAYYLIHSMGSTGSFEEEDRVGAHAFARAARDSGVRRIIYLGGLGKSETGLSSHLRSRQEVGEILRASGVPLIEFRASIVIGSGSLSFEMIRALVERLPVMVTPRWVAVPAQPIAVTDLIDYLESAIDLAVEGSCVIPIGGADRVSYGQLMQEYARQRGLKRTMIPVPVLTPRLSSLWLGLVTPLYARVGRKLVDSLRHPTIVEDDTARRLFPIRPLGVREAIATALRNEDREAAETRWSDALSASGLRSPRGGVRFGSRIVDSRTIRVAADCPRAFAPIRRIGGNTGYYSWNWIWRLRGFVDLLVGGVGVRRGRPHPDRLNVGDPVDWWRVERIAPDRELRLVAEMKVPGRAWLEFTVEPDGDGSIVRQTAIFEPLGLPGLAYWYGLYPIHQWVFAGMLRGIARAAEMK